MELFFCAVASLNALFDGYENLRSRYRFQKKEIEDEVVRLERKTIFELVDIHGRAIDLFSSAVEKLVLLAPTTKTRHGRRTTGNKISALLDTLIRKDEMIRKRDRLLEYIDIELFREYNMMKQYYQGEYFVRDLRKAHRNGLCLEGAAMLFESWLTFDGIARRPRHFLIFDTFFELYPKLAGCVRSEKVRDFFVSNLTDGRFKLALKMSRKKGCYIMKDVVKEFRRTFWLDMEVDHEVKGVVDTISYNTHHTNLRDVMVIWRNKTRRIERENR